jgi:hypothetical protein
MDIGQFLLAYSDSFVSIMTSPFIENSILDEFTAILGSVLEQAIPPRFH